MPGFLSFLNPYTGAIKLGLIALVIVSLVSICGYYVYQYEHKDVVISQQANQISTLNATSAIYKQQLSDYKNDQKKVEDLKTDLGKTKQETYTYLTNLKDAIKKLNLSQTIVTNPVEADIDANQLFDNLLKCANQVTGGSSECVK